MKLRVLTATMVAMILTAGVAQAQTKPATSPARPAAPPAVVDKSHAS